eukprot:3042789-Amphidinium_carterae.1
MQQGSEHQESRASSSKSHERISSACQALPAGHPDHLQWPQLDEGKKARLQQQGREFYETDADNATFAAVVQKKRQKARADQNIEDEYKYSWALWISLESNAHSPSQKQKGQDG